MTQPLKCTKTYQYLLKNQTVLFLWIVLRIIKHQIIKGSENITKKLKGRVEMTILYDGNAIIFFILQLKTSFENQFTI